MQSRCTEQLSTGQKLHARELCVLQLAVKKKEKKNGKEFGPLVGLNFTPDTTRCWKIQTKFNWSVLDNSRPTLCPLLRGRHSSHCNRPSLSKPWPALIGHWPGTKPLTLWWPLHFKCAFRRYWQVPVLIISESYCQQLIMNCFFCFFFKINIMGFWVIFSVSRDCQWPWATPCGERKVCWLVMWSVFTPLPHGLSLACFLSPSLLFFLSFALSFFGFLGRMQ